MSKNLKTENNICKIELDIFDETDIQQSATIHKLTCIKTSNGDGFANMLIYLFVGKHNDIVEFLTNCYASDAEDLIFQKSLIKRRKNEQS